MIHHPDDSSLDDVSYLGADKAARSNPTPDSRIKVGIQTPGGLPDWLVNPSIEDLTIPVIERKAPNSRRYRGT